MLKSSGILVYKKENGRIKVLLCHFGGPYWKGIDKHGWSIPKGLKNDGEKVYDTAIREFEEETNLKISANISFLGSKKVNRTKLVIMFYTEGDFDLTNCKSNTFELEYPRKSGIINTYPEMDMYEYIDIDEAKTRIIPNQLYFLYKLEEKLKDR